MAIEIDNLEIEIKHKSSGAAKQVDELGNALKKIQGITAGATSALENVSRKFGQMSASAQRAINANAKAISSIQKLQSSAQKNSEFEKLEENIKRFQDTLESTPLGSAKSGIKEMGAAFAALPPEVQRAINANAKLESSNKRTANSYGIMGTGVKQWAAQLSIAWLAAFIALIVSFAYQLLAMFEIAPAITQDTVMQTINIVLMMLSALGVLIDPTTTGITDSARAMTYDKPNAEK